MTFEGVNFGSTGTERLYVLKSFSGSGPSCSAMNISKLFKYSRQPNLQGVQGYNTSITNPRH